MWDETSCGEDSSRTRQDPPVGGHDVEGFRQRPAGDEPSDDWVIQCVRQGQEAKPVRRHTVAQPGGRRDTDAAVGVVEQARRSIHATR